MLGALCTFAPLILTSALWGHYYFHSTCEKSKSQKGGIIWDHTLLVRGMSKPSFDPGYSYFRTSLLICCAMEMKTETLKLQRRTWKTCT